jgi:hypothetical protein
MAKIKESTLERLKINKKEPFVVIPLKEWLKIEPILEDYLMAKSKNYIQSIKQARGDIKKKRLYIFDLKTGKLTKVKD